MKKLAIKDLAEQTGVAAGTIRMWEQRYGFPEPARTAAGYRVYTEQDVVALRRVVAYRSRGLSVPAALERARSLEGATDRPSIFAALASGDAPVRPQKLHRSTLIALSRAIEEEAMARAAGPIVIGAFQSEDNYRQVEHRYRRLAHVADAVGVFADFAEARTGNEDLPAEIPIGHGEALGHEWAWSSTRPATPRAWSGGRRRRATANGSSRPSGRWTRRSCAARRRSARRSRRAARRSGPSACSACSPTARWRSRRRRPG